MNVEMLFIFLIIYTLCGTWYLGTRKELPFVKLNVFIFGQMGIMLLYAWINGDPMWPFF